jgi:hypothetical protein
MTVATVALMSRSVAPARVEFVSQLLNESVFPADQERQLWVISGHRNSDQRCPLHSQERTYAASALGSAKCQKTDCVQAAVAL